MTFYSPVEYENTRVGSLPMPDGPKINIDCIGNLPLSLLGVNNPPCNYVHVCMALVALNSGRYIYIHIYIHIYIYIYIYIYVCIYI